MAKIKKPKFVVRKGDHGSYWVAAILDKGGGCTVTTGIACFVKQSKADAEQLHPQISNPRICAKMIAGAMNTINREHKKNAG